MKLSHRHRQHRHPQQFWLEVLTWVVAEVALNLVGLDNLADYGEFIQDTRGKAAIAQIDAAATATRAIGIAMRLQQEFGIT
jgi:hypothetical protein